MNPAPQKSVVLVDDEKAYTELMSLMLGCNLDCPVAAYTRPTDALKALPNLDPVVIVTDYFMPDIDGLEFIRQASQLSPNAVFVLITGHNLSSASEHLSQLPRLKGHLSKPFGWRKLAEEILRVWPADMPRPALRDRIPA